MRKKVEMFNREYRDDRDTNFEDPISAIKKIDNLNDNTTSYLGEGEQVIDQENNRVLIKRNGQLNKQVIDGSEIKLEVING